MRLISEELAAKRVINAVNKFTVYDDDKKPPHLTPYMWITVPTALY